MAEKADIGNFVDDTTFHACGSSLDSLFKRLHDSNLTIEWSIVIT